MYANLFLQFIIGHINSNEATIVYKTVPNSIPILIKPLNISPLKTNKNTPSKKIILFFNISLIFNLSLLLLISSILCFFSLLSTSNTLFFSSSIFPPFFFTLINIITHKLTFAIIETHCFFIILTHFQT